MVYFAPEHPAHPERQPLRVEEWRQHGVRVVHRFEALRAAVRPEREAIVIDAEVLPQVDVGWLRVQARPPRPHVIAAVNLNRRELQETVAVPQPWAADWRPEEPHVAIVAYSDGCAAAGQERFSRFGPLAIFLTERVRRYTACTRQG